MPNSTEKLVVYCTRRQEYAHLRSPIHDRTLFARISGRRSYWGSRLSGALLRLVGTPLDALCLVRAVDHEDRSPRFRAADAARSRGAGQ